MTAFDQIGADRLRDVITEFYRRVFSDVMIGYMFWGKDRQRLIDMEWQFTARLLGADVEYHGRPIDKAHAKVQILGGHFDRRMQILRDVLADMNVPTGVQSTWLEHSENLRSLVTADEGSECNHAAAAERVAGRSD